IVLCHGLAITAAACWPVAQTRGQRQVRPRNASIRDPPICDGKYERDPKRGTRGKPGGGSGCPVLGSLVPSGPDTAHPASSPDWLCSASLPRKSKHGHTWPPPRARVETVQKRPV